MQLFQPTSANLLLKEKSSMRKAHYESAHANDDDTNNSLHSDEIRGLVLLCREALEDDLELEEDVENLPI